MTFEEWIEMNPLREWIAKSKKTRSQSKVASYLGASPYTVTGWVRGQFVPVRFWTKLIDYMGEPDLKERWEAWLRLREEGQVDFGESTTRVAESRR
jgi:hypothetical protein